MIQLAIQVTLGANEHQVGLQRLTIHNCLSFLWQPPFGALRRNRLDATIKPTIAPRPRRKTTVEPPARTKPPTDLYDQIVQALDFIAFALKVTGNRKLLPLFERLERELAALDDEDAVMRRALIRAERQRAPR